jgi:hypothetical protein
VVKSFTQLRKQDLCNPQTPPNQNLPPNEQKSNTQPPRRILRPYKQAHPRRRKPSANRIKREPASKAARLVSAK